MITSHEAHIAGQVISRLIARCEDLLARVQAMKNGEDPLDSSMSPYGSLRSKA